MMYASLDAISTRIVRRTRPSVVGGGLQVNACMHRLVRRSDLHVGTLRSALVGALLRPVERSFPCAQDGVVCLGRVPGPRHLVRLRGTRLLVPVEGRLDPRWVTLVRRAPFGGVQVAAGIRFGGIDVERSAAGHGMRPELLRRAVADATEAVGGPDADWLSPLLLWAAGAG